MTFWSTFAQLDGELLTEKQNLISVTLRVSQERPKTTEKSASAAAASSCASMFLQGWEVCGLTCLLHSKLIHFWEKNQPFADVTT